jgi:nucleoside-diphosphate-sugar epimerase
VPVLAEGRSTVRVLVETVAEAAGVRTLGRSVEPVVGDVRDPTALDRLFDGLPAPTVIHAAGVIHPAGRTREFFDVNVGGTALVADHARRAGAGRLVYVSSNSPFGANTDRDGSFDEASHYNPQSGYGASKMEAELMLLSLCDRGDLEVVIVRPPWFYGPGQPDRQLRFLSLVRRGLFPVVAGGENRRSLVYVDHLVQGVIRAELRDEVAGRSYWVADPTPYPMQEIVATARAAMVEEGLPVRDREPRLPAGVAAGARLLDRAAQRAGRYWQAVHVISELDETIVCSPERAVAELGYRPTIGLLEGMRRSIRDALAEGRRL